MRQYINPIRVQRSSALNLHTPINTITCLIGLLSSSTVSSSLASN